MMDKEKETVKGTIREIKYQNSKKWSVFSVIDMVGTTVSCTGVLSDICAEGSDVELIGDYIVNDYGKQLKCVQVIPVVPDVSTAVGVIKLLQRLPGMGPAKATEAVKRFGPKIAWDIAKIDPTIIGVSEQNCEKATGIAISLINNFASLNYLLGLGLTDNQANLITERFGQYAVEIVSKEPYSLIGNIEGFAFLTVDKIALKAGVKVGSKSRVNACILHCLLDSEINEGHIFLWGKDLCGVVIDRLVDSAKKAEVSLTGLPVYQDVRKAVHWLEEEGKVVIKNGKVFHRDLLDAEKLIMSIINDTYQVSNEEEPF